MNRLTSGITTRFIDITLKQFELAKSFSTDKTIRELVVEFQLLNGAKFRNNEHTGNCIRGVEIKGTHLLFTLEFETEGSKTPSFITAEFIGKVMSIYSEAVITSPNCTNPLYETKIVDIHRFELEDEIPGSTNVYLLKTSSNDPSYKGVSITGETRFLPHHFNVDKILDEGL